MRIRPAALCALLAVTALAGCIESYSLRDGAVDACVPGLTRCGDGCVNTQTASTHCGACGRACVATQSCAAGVCVCATGQHLFGGACVADLAPRPIAPLSLGNVTQRRPLLKWALPPGFDGAVVELCSDRACAKPLETLTVTGSRARPTIELPPRGVVFWRMRARAGEAVDTVYSPTWLFHVPLRSASSTVDTSYSPHFDLNGDGFDDVVVGADNVSSAFVYLGDAGAIPLSGTATTLVGPAASAFGNPVSNAGDVNGDGYADLIVGAPLDSPGGRFQSGTARVFLGGAAGVSTVAAAVLEGVEVGDRFGAAAGASDVNGDGYCDVVVGAYLASPGGRSHAGTASVFLGSASGVSATAVTVLAGGAAGDYFGATVANAGDVNGDGFSDLAVGATHAPNGARGWAGSASVFHGSASGLVATAQAVLAGVANNGLFGSVACAGDANGDGFTDLAVGAAAGASVGGVMTGTASVFHGSPTGINTAPARLLAGVVDGDYFGAGLAGVGDVNGDGYDDLVVGALVASRGGRHQTGTASVFYGSASGVEVNPATVLEGVGALDRFASGLANVGDLNRDGYDDLVVGAHLASPSGLTNAGTASVFLGGGAGLRTTPDAVLTGAARSGGFGVSVARWQTPAATRSAHHDAGARREAEAQTPAAALEQRRRVDPLVGEALAQAVEQRVELQPAVLRVGPHPGA